MQDVAQSVRALVCGAGGRGFEPHLPAKSLVERQGFFRFLKLSSTFMSLIFEFNTYLTPQ
jgi:hypothetical protein